MRRCPRAAYAVYAAKRSGEVLLEARQRKMRACAAPRCSGGRCGECVVLCREGTRVGGMPLILFFFFFLLYS